MSSIAPNGTVRFLTGVPLDENYENSLDFLTKEAQTSFFLGLTPVHVSNNCTRVRDGVIRVDALVETLLPCNYLMFQNTNFGASPFKWFYAFITNIEYVNNNMSYVYYTIDDIQTWLFDVQLKECFVEREHTTTDGLFEHLVDEGIGTSEYMTIASGDKTYSNYVAVLYTSVGDGFTIRGTHAPVQITNGVLKGLSGYVFDLQDSNGNWLELRADYDDPSDPDEHDAIINTGNGLEKLNLYVYDLTVAQQKDSIVGIVIVPKHFIGTTSDIKITQKDAVNDNLGFTNYTKTTPLDGNYVPTNKKLYNSPYCLIDIITSDGQSIHLQPEFLQQGNNLVNILSNMSPSPSILAIPKNYMGNEFAWEKAITYDAFPQGAVSIDGYSAWVASGGLKQLKNSNYRAIAGDVVQGVSSATTQNPVGTVNSVISLVYQVEEFSRKMDVAKKLPAEMIGQSDATPIMTNKMFSIGYRMCSLKKDVLASLDGYFNMFGYKVNKVKMPSRRNRPHYTYLKTKGCHVDGGAPADAIRRIEQIYDNGIRFWVNASEVGQYTTINNSPL
jgi:hypothetical protein